jgi:hypothetical protein
MRKKESQREKFLSSCGRSSARLKGNKSTWAGGASVQVVGHLVFIPFVFLLSDADELLPQLTPVPTSQQKIYDSSSI